MPILLIPGVPPVRFDLPVLVASNCVVMAIMGMQYSMPFRVEGARGLQLTTNTTALSSDAALMGRIQTSSNLVHWIDTNDYGAADFPIGADSQVLRFGDPGLGQPSLAAKFARLRYYAVSGPTKEWGFIDTATMTQIRTT